MRLKGASGPETVLFCVQKVVPDSCERRSELTGIAPGVSVVYRKTSASFGFVSLKLAWPKDRVLFAIVSSALFPVPCCCCFAPHRKLDRVTAVPRPASLVDYSC